MKKIIYLCLMVVLVLALTGCAKEVITGADLYFEAQGTLNESEDELMEADKITKNAKIEQYEGTISGAELKTLVRSILAYNNNDIFPNNLIINDLSEIGIKNESGDYDASSIRTSSKYEITLEYDNDGWVTTVNVSEVKENTSGDTSLNASGEQ